jgi:hypothetical protein
MPPIAIYLEQVPKRTFACAVDWPGWSRSGRTDEAAIESLLSSGPRYARVAAVAQERFRRPISVDDFEIVERLEGSAGTDFGVPSHEPLADRAPMDADELARQTALLAAAWAAFDEAAAAAEGVELRKGPRGGGRDLDRIRGHVREADESYLHQLGRRRPKGSEPAGKRQALIREAMVETLAARVRGTEITDPANVRRPWSPRYFVRRVAWHALDHAWEIEDRAAPDQS